MIEVSISKILVASAVTISNPNKSIFEELGLNITDVGLLVLGGPSWFVAKKVYDFIKRKTTENAEKERMYKEVIRKQQAAIEKQREVNRELERRLRISEEGNRQNQEEIRRLRVQLRNLNDVIKLLKRAQAQVA